jgi:hypothetical protein
MDDECEVIHVAGLARMLSRTEASIREGLCRQVCWLPKSFRMGTRHCWLRDDVMQFLKDCRDGKIETKPTKVGRKRQVPPTLKSIGR